MQPHFGDPQVAQQPGGGIDRREGAVLAALGADAVIGAVGGPADNVEGPVRVFNDIGCQDRPGIDQGLQLRQNDRLGLSRHSGCPKSAFWASYPIPCPTAIGAQGPFIYRNRQLCGSGLIIPEIMD